MKRLHLLNHHSVLKTGAFTLIELLVVISIIALLSSVVLASLNSAREKGRLASAKAFSSQTDRAVGDTAVGWWDFDDCSSVGVMDKSGFGNNGTFSATTPVISPDTPDGPGCSLGFDGTTRYAVIPDSNSLDFLPNQDFTIMFWEKTASTAYQTAISKYDISTNNVGWAVFYSPAGGVSFKFGNGTATVYQSSITGTSDGTWHHVAISVDRSGSCTKYKDGAFYDKASCSSWGSLDLSNTNSLYFGSNLGMGGYNWNGSLDEFRILSSALSTSEIERVFAQGAARHGFALK